MADLGGFLTEPRRRKIAALVEKGTLWLKTDGCAKQYKCSKAM